MICQNKHSSSLKNSPPFSNSLSSCLTLDLQMWQRILCCAMHSGLKQLEKCPGSPQLWPPVNKRANERLEQSELAFRCNCSRAHCQCRWSSPELCHHAADLIMSNIYSSLKFCAESQVNKLTHVNSVLSLRGLKSSCTCLATFFASCFLWFLSAVLDNGLSLPFDCSFMFCGGSSSC